MLATRFRAEEGFSLMLPELEFQFQTDAASRSTAQTLLWCLGAPQQ